MKFRILVLARRARHALPHPRLVGKVPRRTLLAHATIAVEADLAGALCGAQSTAHLLTP